MIKETRASPGHEAKMEPRVELGTVGLKVNCHVRKFVSVANKVYSLCNSFVSEREKGWVRVNKVISSCPK